MKAKIRLIKLIDMIFGYLLCLILGYIDFIFNLSLKNTKIQNPKKVLFIRPGGMGDFLYLLPAINELKTMFPDIEIHVLAERRNKRVAELTKSIATIYCYDDSLIKTLKRLFRERYDVVIDTEQIHHSSALMAYITRAKVRIGFKIKPVRNHLYTHLIDYSLSGHESMEFMKLLSPFGIKDRDIFNDNYLKMDGGEKGALSNEIHHIINNLKPYVVIAPRGQERYRYWAPYKYKAIINYLLKTQNDNIVIVGGRAEKDIVKEIMKGMENIRVISMVGKTSFFELYMILSKAKLFIGCDSGVSILASMLGVKSIVLFGSADENKWAWRGKNCIAIRKRLSCSPCQVLGKYKLCKEILCMKFLSPKEVIKILKDYL